VRLDLCEGRFTQVLIYSVEKKAYRKLRAFNWDCFGCGKKIFGWEKRARVIFSQRDYYLEKIKHGLKADLKSEFRSK
jgi:hypothetical protein